MFLFIDPVSDFRLTLILFDSSYQVFRKKRCSSHIKVERFLKIIHSFLTANNLSFKDIKGIVVVKGPGSFFTLRGILTLVNIISLILQIPAIALCHPYSQNQLKKALKTLRRKKKFRIILPFYGRPPKIHLKK